MRGLYSVILRSRLERQNHDIFRLSQDSLDRLCGLRPNHLPRCMRQMRKTHETLSTIYAIQILDLVRQYPKFTRYCANRFVFKTNCLVRKTRARTLLVRLRNNFIHLPSSLASSAPIILVFAAKARLWRANFAADSSFKESSRTEAPYSSGHSHSAAPVNSASCVRGSIDDLASTKATCRRRYVGIPALPRGTTTAVTALRTDHGYSIEPHATIADGRQQFHLASASGVG
jgi:hypothetical protein